MVAKSEKINKEKLRQITIQAWKDDVYDFQECNGSKIDGFECEKTRENIRCELSFKDSKKKFRLTIDPSVSYYRDLTHAS